jgi:sec-independent protein translocase protein TatA
MGIESPVHLLFIAAVALIVLGPKRLPALARALGQGIREFRGALEQGASSTAEPTEPTEPPPATAPTPTSETTATPAAHGTEPPPQPAVAEPDGGVGAGSVDPAAANEPRDSA